MVSSAEASAALMRKMLATSRVSVAAGLVKSAVWAAGVPVTVITVDGVDFTNLPIVGSASLVPGMTVNVLRLPGQLIVLGPATVDVQPLQGTVSATGTGTCQVQLSYSSGTRTVSAPWLQHYTPVVGHVVMIAWAYGTPVVVGRLSQALATGLEPPYIPPLPPPVPTTGTETFNATDSGTRNSSKAWWPGKDVEANVSWELTYGWWFYGATIKSTMAGRVPNGTPSIYLDTRQTEYGLDLFLHTATKRSGVTDASIIPGDPFHASVASGARGWYAFPTAWAAALIANGGGIGVSPGGDNARLAGIDANSQSGALRIPWKKS